MFHFHPSLFFSSLYWSARVHSRVHGQRVTQNYVVQAIHFQFLKSKVNKTGKEHILLSGLINNNNRKKKALCSLHLSSSSSYTERYGFEIVSKLIFVSEAHFCTHESFVPQLHSYIDSCCICKIYDNFL